MPIFSFIVSTLGGLCLMSSLLDILPWHHHPENVELLKAAMRTHCCPCSYPRITSISYNLQIYSGRHERQLNSRDTEASFRDNIFPVSLLLRAKTTMASHGLASRWSEAVVSTGRYERLLFRDFTTIPQPIICSLAVVRTLNQLPIKSSVRHHPNLSHLSIRSHATTCS
jgi:hypothetical protein